MDSNCYNNFLDVTCGNDTGLIYILMAISIALISFSILKYMLDRRKRRLRTRRVSVKRGTHGYSSRREKRPYPMVDERREQQGTWDSRDARKPSSYGNRREYD